MLSTKDGSMETSYHRKNQGGIVFVVMFLVVIAAILAGSYFTFVTYEQAYRVEAEHGLSSIAELKANQLMQYRKERLEDVSILFKNDALSGLVWRVLQKRSDRDAQCQLRGWMSKYTRENPCDLVLLLDAHGAVRLSTSDTLQSIPMIIQNSESEVLVSGMNCHAGLDEFGMRT